MSRLIYLFVISFWSAVLTSCGGESIPVATVVPQLSAPANRWADDVGRYLGGMPAKPGSKLEAVHQDPLFKQHSAGFDDSWLNFEKSRQPAMQRFQRSELTEAPFKGATIFYPFGGPDTLTAITFFPDNSNYLLIGLEPPGALPSEENLREKPLGAYLPKIRGVMSSLLTKSFFVTQSMSEQVRGQITDGLLPLMLVQLVRTRNTVLGILPVTLDDKGELVERKQAGTGIAGVLIEFQRDGVEGKKRLVYLSANLSNEPLRKNQPLLSFLSKQKPMVTYFKAASYLCHRVNFSFVREQILELSSAVLGDDSGIPYKYYDPAVWNVQLYGKYDKPYGSFQKVLEFRQPALKAAYDAAGVKPLDFPIGYGFSRIPANLLLAKKK